MSAEEGFVLSRLDIPLSRDEIVEQTAIDGDRVDSILALLEDKGLAASDAPSIRPPMATVPDGDFEDTPPAPVVPAVSGSEAPPPWTEPPPPPVFELDPNVLDTTFREIYDKKIRPLPVEQRITIAGRQKRDTLFALCFDPEPVVIRAVLMNPEVAVSHARVIALNHADPLGLELFREARGFYADSQVEWLLLRNAALPESMAREILATKAVTEIYALWADTVVADCARTIARGVIRERFDAAPPEERAAMIAGTEGEVLGALPGIVLDGRTTMILCSRGTTSTTFVRNLLKMGSCPGVLLGHLAKQQLVKRNPQLFKMVLAHPNTPGDVKRKA